MTPDEQKDAAARAAAALVEPGMLVGLGTGSTAAFFVKALAARALPVRCVATSSATAVLAKALGMTVLEFGAEEIDLTVDGADEIGPGLSLIKGGGAALLREKLVWEASRRCIVVADASKTSNVLGRAPLPIEVVAFGAESTRRRISAALSGLDLNAETVLRTKDGAAVLTDGGNVIFDVACGRIDDPSALGAALKGVTGVVEHGLFLGLARQALIGGDLGVQTLHA
jgi:ribose 5-phosphate isomerase A